MDYLVREVSYVNGQKKTAGIKARKDIEEIVESNGFSILEIPSMASERNSKGIFGKIEEHFSVINKWYKILDSLNKNDRLLIQFPVIEHSIFFYNFLKKAKKKGIVTILLIHDLEMMRYANSKDISNKKKMRINIEELKSLKISSYVIAHNKKMVDYLLSKRINKDALVNLEIFDYWLPFFDVKKANERSIVKNGPVIIAGNLNKNKVGYIYDLPHNIQFNLYGVGYEPVEETNVIYNGSFNSDDLVYALNGSFGLVWDGASSKTCSGMYGEYLRINNPHKTSLYLASNLPVVIWKEAALSSFILENKCGIVVDSLDELNLKILRLTKEDYDLMVENAKKLGEKMRKGYYTCKAIALCK